LPIFNQFDDVNKFVGQKKEKKMLLLLAVAEFFVAFS
jgi:hypothetical protein